MATAQLLLLLSLCLLAIVPLQAFRPTAAPLAKRSAALRNDGTDTINTVNTGNNEKSVNSANSVGSVSSFLSLERQKMLRRVCGTAVGAALLALPSTASMGLRLAPAAALAAEPATATDTATVAEGKPVIDNTIKKLPLFNKRSADLTAYSDVGRGFKLLRPFGYNEFEGGGGGYAVKFASLFDVDENVVIGIAPASSDKSSIEQYGTLEQLADKLLKKREGGSLVSAKARETDGVVFYMFEFDTKLDPTLPRPGSKSKKPTKGIELYQLCVSRGKLWSVQATSNDVLFPAHDKTLRAALYSFFPRL